MIFRRIFTPLVLATTLLVGRPALAENAADIALARDLYKQGAAFANEGKWNEARERYEKSLALKRAPRTLYSLGVAYQNLRRFVESLESYRAFLVEATKDDDKPYEQPARDAVAQLEKQVARFDIKVLKDVDDVKMTLTIDGSVVPEAAYGYPRLVDPGTHVVAVRADGYREAKQSVTISEGEKQNVTLRLVSLSKTPPIQGASKSDTPPLPTALFAAGSTAFAVGLTVGLVGVQKAADAVTRDGEAAESARRLALAGDIVGGVGLVAAGAGLTLMVVDKYRKQSRGPTKPNSGWVLPIITPGGVGLMGRF